MTERRHARDEIVRKLRRADELLAKGVELSEVLKDLRVSQAIYDHWRAQEARATARRVGFAITVIALITVAIHASFPDLAIDTVAVALLALAALPWLGEILESVDLPGGGGWKYRTLAERVVEAQHAASEATVTATRAFDRAENLADDVEQERGDAAGLFARNAQTVDAAAIAGAPADESSQGTNADELADLIERYNEVRATQRSGSARTAEMTRIVREMIRIVGRLATFDWEESLESADRGRRLAGYAYLFQDPICSAARPLIHSLMEVEDKPFGQYWGLKALRRVVASCDDATARQLEAPLRDFAARFPPGTDRGQELRELLEEIDNREVPSGR